MVELDWKNWHPLVRAVRLAALGWFFFCFLFLFVTLLCTGLVGYRFLPSTEWVSTTDRLGAVVGGVTALLLFSLVFLGVMRQLRDGTLEGAWKPALVVLFTPVVGYFVGRTAAIIAAPMVLALIAGHHEELPYTVGRVDKHYEKHCYSPLELQGLIVGFDRVCGVSDEFRKGLTTGADIVVVGHGTRYGLFATALRRDD
ncbi:hypothetical protein [Rhizobium sp. RCC_161_2]|uniref:hypothetical protein n=1 Tax=Rhizobium sp. RCC_161_2 TaxID=3239219 RepID=UPI003523715E